ncbi:MAG: hypothetical protein Q8L23_00405 [Caulobacter sp.]|nr:hypothetical protein [Caulobacter sp.]
MGRRIQHTEEFVGDIVEALKAYGGAAHRSLVVEQIAVSRGRRGAPLPGDSAGNIQREFESHLGDLFRLPFGEGSHRWALAGATDRA